MTEVGGGRLVGRKYFGAEKGAEISMGRGRGWVFGSFAKQLQ